MKVDELTGLDLDYWVWQAQQGALTIKMDNGELVDNSTAKGAARQISFEDWAPIPFHWEFIGPMIERDHLCVNPSAGNWVVYSTLDTPVIRALSEMSALEAIKRCIVKRKYGDELTGLDHDY